MRSILDQTPAGARVAVIRLRSMGDCILTTPALAILKNARPDLRVAVVVEDRFAALFEGNPDVYKVLPPSAGELREFRPRLCLNLHGGPTSMALVLLSGARWRAGFDHFRPGMVYNVRIPTAQEILGVSRKVHTAEHLASAIFYLGVRRCEIPRARLFADPPGSRAPYAVLHPAATGTGKTWPAGSFLRVAQFLEKDHGLRPVFIAGPGEDLSPFRDYETLAGAPLREVMSLVSGASVFVGNDSGPAHMAAAFGVPVAVLFGNSDPVIWGPWKTRAETLVSPGAIEKISPEQVRAAVRRLLKEPA
jgi:ADP-heptose:LPS heptosyltransferase